MTSELYNKICEYLRDTVAGTPWEGHLFAVGGCCRDRILGDPIKDIDLAVDLPDGGVRFTRWLDKHHLAKGRPVLFKRFGTARMSLRRFPDVEIELVQTRKGKYGPETDRDPSIAFGSIEEDSFRRDLTMNTLFYDISRQKLLDPTGMALDDIRNRRLRTPLDPDLTFEDDPVRIIRCLRFALRYGHEIDSATLEAMQRHSSGLQSISRERIHSEFDKVLMTPDPVKGVRILREVGALEEVMPELNDLVDEIDSNGVAFYEKALTVLDRVASGVGQEAPLAMRIAALLSQMGKVTTRRIGKDGRSEYPGHALACARSARMIMRRMRYDREISDEVVFYLENIQFAEGKGSNGEKLKDRQLRRFQLICRTKQRFDNLMKFIEATAASDSDNELTAFTATLRNRTEMMVARGDALFDYKMPLTVEEIMEGLHCRTRGDYEKAAAKLLRAMCSDPNRSKQEFMKALSIDPNRRHDGGSKSKKRRKRGGRRHRGRRESGGDNQSSK